MPLRKVIKGKRKPVTVYEVIEQKEDIVQGWTEFENIEMSDV